MEKCHLNFASALFLRIRVDLSDENKFLIKRSGTYLAWLVKDLYNATCAHALLEEEIHHEQRRKSSLKPPIMQNSNYVQLSAVVFGTTIKTSKYRIVPLCYSHITLSVQSIPERLPVN